MLHDASTSSIARCRSSATILPITRIADDDVTHLECSLTGERYEAGQVHNLSKRGKAAAGALRSRGGEARR